MEEDYQKALEVIFAYSYGCYVFKHNIYGDQLVAPDGMPDSSDPLLAKVFISPKYPLVLAAFGDMRVEAHPGEVAKEPEGNASARD